MPLLDLACPSCGHEYETVTTSAEGARDAKACPKCGSTPVTRPMAGIVRPEINLHDIPPLELQGAFDNKRRWEARSEEILDGRVTLKEGRIKELRPELPDHLKKRYF